MKTISRKIPGIVLSSLVSIALSSGILFAETLHLKNGETVEGNILAKTPDAVTINTGGVNVTYYADEIVAEEPAPSAAATNQNTLPAPVMVPETPQRTTAKNAPRQLPPAVEQRAPAVLPAAKPLPPPAPPAPAAEVLPKTDIAATPAGDLSLTQRLVLAIQTKIKQSNPDAYATLQTIAQNIHPKALLISAKLFFADQLTRRSALGVPVLFFPTLPIYIFLCLPFGLLAHKLGMEATGMFIPVVQIFQLLHLSDKPFWWFILLFIPFVNLFVWVSIWKRICEFLRQPEYLSYLMLIPGVNLALVWYLALSPSK
ncbi:MAG: hypothetical protein HQL23_09270 [Candidatus Omnitrophica bacterium]|nr:hypothetical protein [Candidatus Omnitrophota bacterium]